MSTDTACELLKVAGSRDRDNPGKGLVGMLYMVDVNLEDDNLGEIIKHRLIMVGSERSDIDRKIYWMFRDSGRRVFIVKVKKLREKIHIMRTFVTQKNEAGSVVIDRNDRSQVVTQGVSAESNGLKLFAVGVTTSMVAKDDLHAMRKVGNVLISRGTQTEMSSMASLSNDSNVIVEEIAFPRKHASARDVSNEVNRAKFVRG